MKQWNEEDKRNKEKKKAVLSNFETKSIKL